VVVVGAEEGDLFWVRCFLLIRNRVSCMLACSQMQEKAENYWYKTPMSKEVGLERRTTDAWKWPIKTAGGPLTPSLVFHEVTTWVNHNSTPSTLYVFLVSIYALLSSCTCSFKGPSIPA